MSPFEGSNIVEAGACAFSISASYCILSLSIKTPDTAHDLCLMRFCLKAKFSLSSTNDSRMLFCGRKTETISHVAEFPIDMESEIKARFFFLESKSVMSAFLPGRVELNYQLPGPKGWCATDANGTHSSLLWGSHTSHLKTFA